MASCRVTRGGGLLEPFLAQRRWHMANRLIPTTHRTGRLLDLGCGPTPQFLLHTRFAERYGLDTALTPSATAQGRRQGIHVLTYNLEPARSLPFRGASFDVVTLLAVLEHLAPPSLNALIREVHRALKPGGVFIMTTPAAWTDGLLRILAALRVVSPVEIGDHKDIYDHSRVVSLLTAAGFPQTQIDHGFFELGMNLWLAARK